MAVDLSSYLTVPERIAEFRAKHPQGCLRPADQYDPFKVVQVGDKTFIAYTALAYRTPDDPTPGIGTAWEPFPGRTPYTKDSELMNAETSAWGRAIVAVLASDTTKGIATQEEIRNRQESGEKAQSGQKAPGAYTAISPDIGTLLISAKEAKTLDLLRSTWTQIGNGGHLTSEIAHPETGEKLTFQEYLYERADALGGSKSTPENGAGNAGKPGNAASAVAGKRGAK